MPRSRQASMTPPSEWLRPGVGQQLLAPSDDLETFERRRLGREGVRLVHDAAGDEAQFAHLPPSVYANVMS